MTDPVASEASVHCRSCNYDLTGTALGGTCPECGMPVNETLQPLLDAGKARASGSTKATTSLILGILSVLVCPGTAPFAVAYGVGALKEANDRPDQGGRKVMAWCGIVTGGIGVAVLVFVILRLIFGIFT